MARVVFFCIPAHGHTNPTLPVVRALTAQGHDVIYYSFEPFRAAIEAAGARFMPCDGYGEGAGPAGGAAVALDIVAAAKLISDTTLAMDGAVTRQLAALRPDVIVSDSVAYWGKLFAMKLGIPYVCSCTTFAFNRHSAAIMKQTPGELLRTLLRMPAAKRRLAPLRAAGYPARGILSIIQNDEATPTVVYTSPEFQPCSDTFSDKYSFVGPCIARPGDRPERRGRALVYVSMGSVIEGQGDFFRQCAEAFRDGRFDVLMSLGGSAEPESLGAMPENVRVSKWVDQTAVLQTADVFVTHCGMNSASEALWNGVPLVMRPMTPEEGGVARRVAELGAGLMLQGTDAAAIRGAVDRALSEPGYRRAAGEIAAGFRRCGGPEAAARAILAAVPR